jgi:methanogenic corrinoid protein MtbC1
MGLRTVIDGRLSARDRTGAVRAAVDAVRSGAIGVDELYSRVLTPLLVDTGAGWQTGGTRIWEEHYASATVRTIIESLYLEVAQQAEAVGSSGRAALLACPAGEQHDLGLRMLADRMAMRGWDVYFLGADTPASEVVAAARAVGAELVVLAAATHYNLVLLRTYLEQLKADLPGIRIGVGGPAFACSHGWAAEDLLNPQEIGLDDDPSGFCPLPNAEG